jgi:phosphopantothenoylcysteine synthetase/decarboxylase
MNEEGSAEFYKELWMKEQKIRLEQNDFVELYQSAVTEREMERLKEHNAELIARENGTLDCSASNYTTRCGHPVRIYARDGGIARKQIHGAVFTKSLGWSMFSWMPNGQAYSTDPIHDYDLIKIKPSS